MMTLQTEITRFLALREDIWPPEFSLVVELCMIGRSSSCQIVVPWKTASKLHAKIEHSDLHYVLSDAGSANGTFVNGQRIYQPRLLRHRDVIGLGAAVPMLRFSDPHSTIDLGNRLLYDEQRALFMLGQQQLPLSRMQHRLLLHLYRNAGDICTFASCIEMVFGVENPPNVATSGLNTLADVINMQLRQLMPDTRCLLMKTNIGYELSC